MGKETKLIVVAVFLTLILGVGGKEKDANKRGAIFVTSNTGDPSGLCSNSFFAPFLSWCRTTSRSTNAPPTAPGSTTDMIIETTTSYFDLVTAHTTVTDEETSSLSPTNLQRAHWCRFPNGSYATLYSIFRYQSCSVCQCLASHEIRCSQLQCMTTHCIDKSVPVNRAGQCCPQCTYEPPSISCTYNGIPFPHGTVLKRTSDNLQCWCQYGTVECRKSASSAFTASSFLNGGTTIYIIIIIIIGVVLLGAVLCISCTLFFYYYYQRNQEAYEQNYNGGWQPMDAEEQVVDAAAQEKQMEAEQSQYQAEYTQEYIQPPYAFYNGAYPNEETVQYSK